MNGEPYLACETGAASIFLSRSLLLWYTSLWLCYDALAIGKLSGPKLRQGREVGGGQKTRLSRTLGTSYGLIGNSGQEQLGMNSAMRMLRNHTVEELLHSTNGEVNTEVLW
jgi:hypothetical protein